MGYRKVVIYVTIISVITALIPSIFFAFTPLVAGAVLNIPIIGSILDIVLRLLGLDINSIQFIFLGFMAVYISSFLVIFFSLLISFSLLYVIVSIIMESVKERDKHTILYQSKINSRKISLLKQIYKCPKCDSILTGGKDNLYCSKCDANFQVEE